jgi:MFS superfamily sulfate permease-like transporter
MMQGGRKVTQPDNGTTAAPTNARRAWPLFRSFAGWHAKNFGVDVLAGLTLAAIAIPEQMATARLAGFPPEIGLLALLAGAVGFAVFGGSRTMSVGADSTIAPIFAGALAALAAAGPPHYAAAVAALSLAVGLMLILGGAFRLGFIADLLSIPVTTGFLAGVACHILVSQAPSVLGLEQASGPLFQQVLSLAARLGSTNGWTLSISVAVFMIMIVGERLNPRFPSALIGLVLAALLTMTLGLEARGVTTLGVFGGAALHFSWPGISMADLRLVVPLAIIITLVAMVQTAATTRAFADEVNGPDVDCDFIGVGAANALAGLIGAFPVDASPPRTAIVSQFGGASQLAGLVSAALALVVFLFGGRTLLHVPHAALAGVLLFIATRIVRVGVIADVWRRSRPEFLLILATVLAMLALPIEQGVGFGVVLSLLHGIWTTTRAKAVEFQRIRGTSIWWPRNSDIAGELVPGVRVIALQAPLSFLNAYDFRDGIERLAGEGGEIKLIVIEANALVEIDYTGATVLANLIRRLRRQGVDVAIARLESVRAQESLERQGLFALIGRDHVFHSVEEAVDALAGSSPTQ